MYNVTNVCSFQSNVTVKLTCIQHAPVARDHHGQNPRVNIYFPVNHNTVFLSRDFLFYFFPVGFFSPALFYTILLQELLARFYTFFSLWLQQVKVAHYFATVNEYEKRGQNFNFYPLPGMLNTIENTLCIKHHCFSSELVLEHDKLQVFLLTQVCLMIV